MEKSSILALELIDGIPFNPISIYYVGYDIFSIFLNLVGLPGNSWDCPLNELRILLEKDIYG